MNQATVDIPPLSEIVPDLLWRLVAGALDLLRFANQGVFVGIVMFVVLASVANAFLMQYLLNAQLRDKPQTRVSLWRLEAWFTLPGLLVLPFRVLPLLLRRMGGKLKGLTRRGKNAAGPDVAADPAAKPVLVATLGPSFFLAGLITVVLYLLMRFTEPMLAGALGLSNDYPAWQYWLMGGRPEVGWYLPLERYPWMAGLLAFGFWMLLWVWAGRIIRLVLSRDLGRDLLTDETDPELLPLWRKWFGADRLFRPTPVYLSWAWWLVGVAFVMLGLAWSNVGGDPYRISGSESAVVTILWVSWLSHLILRGVRVPRPPVLAEDKPKATANGWLQILEELKTRHQALEPYPFDAPRLIRSLHFVEEKNATNPVISPLLGELLPSPRQMTRMQYEILETLSRQSYVHIELPPKPGELTLGAGETSGMRDLSGQRHRNQIVLAPEGFGKTMLGILAACNQVLGHTQATLMVVRDSQQAGALCQRFVDTVRRTTLRWNVRVREAGPDLATDMARDILPDVLITGLDRLVTSILEQPDVYDRFLKRVGLIVVDDVESFAGPVEIHAQLAFRRLGTRYRNLLDVGAIGSVGAPQMLVLGAESMHGTATWAKTLCGIDAVSRLFGFSDEESWQREAARNLSRGIVAEDEKTAKATVEPTKEESADPAKTGDQGKAKGDEEPVQRFFRMADFRMANGDRLTLLDLVSACERLSVPWHYRRASDQDRRLGRGALQLHDEPQAYVPDPTDACVVFVDGEWSEMRRECMRLRRAGARFSRVRDENGAAVLGKNGLGVGAELIAMVTLGDPDLDMALTQRDPQGSLTAESKTMPRPILRPITNGDAARAHLTCDLVRSWTEVGDLVSTFGEQIVPEVLRQLAKHDLLLSDERMDIRHDINEFQTKLMVRALADAVEQTSDKAGILPAKVAQVEQVAARRVHLRDRTSTLSLGETDAMSASYRYYAGRIFSDARGRFVVIGRSSDDKGGVNGASVSGDLLVDPILVDDVSSPRWRHRFKSANGVRGVFFGPESVLFGACPVAIELQPKLVEVEHIATYRLGPHSLELRQRTVFEASKREKMKAAALPTIALGLRPNPRVEGVEADAVPRLTLEQARLVAAAMCAVLPSIYRGAANDIDVALDIRGPLVGDRPLEPDEGIVLFDLDEGGNGTAQSLHRDGVELLLRLCRSVIERVLYHDRLRALHDHWGDDQEILSGKDPIQAFLPRKQTTDEKAPAPNPAELRREHDSQVREGTLTWLDSRLRPEGGGAAQAGIGRYGSGMEKGEGDVFDIGRCWYSQDERVTDLLWTKHRWRLENGGEAALDVAFDRKTAEQSRYFTEKDEVLEQYLSVYAAHMKVEDFKLPDGTVWGAPCAVGFATDEEDAPGRSKEGLCSNPAVVALHAFFCAVAAHSKPALKPLADALAKACPNARDRNALAAYVARFVQGIPYSQPVATRLELRPPVSTLLYRLGDCDSKSLLLALLLKHCDIEAGLFISLDDGHAMCGMSLPGFVSGEGDDLATGTQEHVEAWRKMTGLGEPVSVWSVQPDDPKQPDQQVVYVPIETTAEMRPGQTGMLQRDTWVYLPLSVMWMRFETEETLAPSDASETESTLNG